MTDPYLSQTRLTGRGTTASPLWLPVTRGVQRHRHAPDPWRATLRAWQEALGPEWTFTHLTAARLRGWWLPAQTAGLPVLVAGPRAAPRPRRPGLLPIRRVGSSPQETVDGLRVDPPEEVLLACARDLGLLDLLCLIEGARAVGDCVPEELVRRLPPRRRGVPVLRAACELARPGAESLWEVLLRELHRWCGAEVVAQHEVLAADGRFLARADLWLVGTRTLHEYDGAHHLAPERQRSDLRRARALVNEGYVRRGYTSIDLLHRASSVLADIDLALGREHDPARVRGWHELLRDSVLTPAGARRLRHRLRLPPDV